MHHAGWDVPNYRWYDLEGLPVGQTTSGDDLLIERECTHVSLAAAAVASGRGARHAIWPADAWHDAGRALSQALSRARLPHPVDCRRPLRRSVAIELDQGSSAGPGQGETGVNGSSISSLNHRRWISSISSA